MAQNNADGTGSLMLVRRTPIINAFFGAMLGEEPPVTGDVREDVLRQSTENIEPPTWDSILEALTEIVRNDLECPEEATLADCLRVLMDKYGRHDQWLIDLLPSCEGEDDSTADFALCFDLASVFDDGHGLVSMSMEVAYTCSRLIHGQFGGFGEYVSREAIVYGGSGAPLSRGQRLTDALVLKEPQRVLDIVAESVEQILNEIRSDSTRREIRGLLAKRLSNPPV